ncbi:MAG TPA: SDR family NAD(P)-dependent oxidoreductase [Anaerolineales bacterium]|nr:SDR family NAD(P)-dependent oxidoreductase [Anaerolineales bacterium]
MASLKGKVAIVTGASRGVGKGIALGLGEEGATVYVTGRSTEEKTDVEKLGGTVFSTAEAVTAMGGKGIALHCDHREDSQVEDAFKRIAKESKRIDLLVNNAWGGYEKMREGRAFTYFKPFWEQPFWRWDAMFDAGVRAAYTASALAARLMTKKKSGLIVNISFWSAQVYMNNTQYGVSKAAVDKMTEYMAHELKKYKVAVLSLYPGLVRTESVMRSAKHFDMSNSESPQFIGRVVAALARDPHIMKKSGQVLVAAQEALEYGIQDIDGKQPRPVTLEDFKK